jgi:hypothetical protein
MKRFCCALLLIALFPYSSLASELSVYDCGPVARVIKDVEPQSSHRVEINLSSQVGDPSTLAVPENTSIELVSLDGTSHLTGTMHNGTLVFAAVTPGSWKLCDLNSKFVVSTVFIDDSVTQASTKGLSLAGLAAGGAAIGGGIAAFALGNSSGQTTDSASRAGATGTLITSGQNTGHPSSTNSARSPDETLCFVGHDEDPVSPFS